MYLDHPLHGGLAQVLHRLVRERILLRCGNQMANIADLDLENRFRLGLSEPLLEARNDAPPP
jgi:hypothetical protein